jgi:hypothetical protein
MVMGEIHQSRGEGLCIQGQPIMHDQWGGSMTLGVGQQNNLDSRCFHGGGVAKNLFNLVVVGDPSTTRAILANDDPTTECTYTTAAGCVPLAPLYGKGTLLRQGRTHMIQMPLW